MAALTYECRDNVMSWTVHHTGPRLAYYVIAGPDWDRCGVRLGYEHTSLQL